MLRKPCTFSTEHRTQRSHAETESKASSLLIAFAVAEEKLADSLGRTCYFQALDLTGYKANFTWKKKCAYEDNRGITVVEVIN